MGTQRVSLAHEEEIENAIDRQPRCVIDAGAAEGYYTVGLAVQLPTASVTASEIDPEARRVCRQTARMNLVPNLRVGLRITPGELRRRAVARCSDHL